MQLSVLCAVATVRVDRIEQIAVSLAALTAVIHLGLGGGLLLEYARTGTLPSALAPLFVLTGLVVTLGIGTWASGLFDRETIYTGGALLMLLHLVLYLDWHFLHVFEGIVDLGDLGHGHGHTHHDRVVAMTLLEATPSAPEAAVAFLSQGSLVVAAVHHAATTPVEWISKLAEVALVALLLVLRWAERREIEVVRWRPRRTDLWSACAAATAGLTAWLAVLLLGGSLVDRGVSPLFIDVLELTIFGMLLFAVGWFSFGAAIVEATSGETISMTKWLPAMEPGSPLPNVAIAVVYIIAFLAVAGTLIAFVPSDAGESSHDHHHDHGPDDELEALMDSIEAEGVHVDREWTTIHYSEYHGGDALLFDHVVDPETDMETVHAEIAVIVEAYVEAVEEGALVEVVALLGEAWSPADESFARWEVERTWVDAYLDGEWSWDRLLETVLDTYEERH